MAVTSMANTSSIKSGVVAGKILQVVSATKVNAASTTSPSFSDIADLSVAITPSAVSNKIMVFVQLSFSHSASNTESSFNLVRDSTNLLQSTAGSSSNATFHTATSPTSVGIYGAPIMFLDSPSSTSSTTYKIQWRTGGGTFYVNRRGVSAEFGSTSTITLMEVAG